MDGDETGRQAALEFVAQHHRGVLSTTRLDGRPSLTPVVAGRDREAVVISTRRPSHKVRHLERLPYATLCLFADRFFGPWIQLEGPVTILPLPEAMEGLVALYRQIAGEHRDWDDFRRAMEEEQRVLLCLSPERVGPSPA